MPGVGRASAGDATLIFMVKPLKEAAEEINRLRRTLGIDASYPADHLHITLVALGSRRSVGEVGRKVALDAAGSLDEPCFRVVFERVVEGLLLGREKIIGLISFQQRLGKALTDAGLVLPDYRFQPHISLAYRGMRAGAWDIVPISWKVEEFLLVESVRGRHEVLGRWALGTKGSSSVV